MPTLHLTTAEQSLFDALPESLRDGVTVEAETGKFTDTDEKRAIRIRNLQVKHEGLHAIKNHIASAKKMEDIVHLAQAFDFSSLSKDDLIELYFVMGPDPMTVTIEQMFAEAKTSEDIEDIAALTFIRHGVLTVLQ